LKYNYLLIIFLTFIATKAGKHLLQYVVLLEV